MARAGALRRFAGLPAVHVGLDLRPQGRDGDPCQPAAQRGGDPAQLRHVGGVRRGGLAAALPRHGADRHRAAAALCRRSLRADVAPGLSAAAGAVAGGDLAIPGDDERRSELRLRALRPADRRGAEGGAGPVVLDGRLQRRRARAGRDPGALHPGVRVPRVPPAGLLSLLRSGGIDPFRRRRLAAHRAADAELQAGGSRGGTGDAEPVGPRGAASGELRPRPRPGARGGGSGEPHPIPARASGGAVARRAECRPGVLGPAAGDGSRFRSAPDGRAGPGSVPAHGRPRFRRRRRAVHHRPAQGPHHPPGAQPLPAGHRADGGAQPPRAAARRRRGLLRRGRWRGAAGRRSRGGAPQPQGGRPGGSGGGRPGGGRSGRRSA